MATPALPTSAQPSAAGQWLWIDGQGRRVHSDRPPPASVPPQRVLARPGLAASQPSDSPREGLPSPGRPEAPQAAAVASAQARVAAMAAQLAASQRAEDERVGRQRADNCRRAMTAKATLDAGIRLTRVNDQGEREILDDTARAAESKRLQAIIASDCGSAH